MCVCRLVCVWVSVRVPVWVPVGGCVCGAYGYVCMTLRVCVRVGACVGA